MPATRRPGRQEADRDLAVFQLTKEPLPWHHQNETMQLEIDLLPQAAAALTPELSAGWAATGS
jgi:hypothetical protein